MKNAQDDEDTFQQIGLAADKLISNLISSGKVTKTGSGPDIIGGSSMPGVIEDSEPNHCPLPHEASDVLVIPRSIDPLEPSLRLRPSLIGVILLTTRLSQVFKPIVATAAIDMVYQPRRPFSRAIEPSQPTASVKNSINADDVVSVHLGDMASWPANEVSATSIKTHKHTCLSIVRKRRSQTLQGQKVVVKFKRHLALPRLTIGLHAALILNKFRNSVQTNGLGDAGPVDEVSKDDERDGGRNSERCEERENEHPRRASA
jgi:hypothetical protein